MAVAVVFGVPVLKLVISFPFGRYDILSVSAVIGLVILTFGLLSLKLVRIIVRRMVSLPTNCAISGIYRFRLMGQHLSDAPCDLATLTFDLGGYRACR